MLGNKPTRIYGVTNYLFVAFLYLLKLRTTKEREVIFMMTAIYSMWFKDLRLVRLGAKNLIRSILEEVSFVIPKYLCLASDRTLGEYV